MSGAAHLTYACEKKYASKWMDIKDLLLVLCIISQN